MQAMGCSYRRPGGRGERDMKPVVEELRDIRWLKLQTEREREHAARLREQIVSTTSNIGRIGSRSDDQDAMGSRIAALVDMENDVLGKILEAEQRIRGVERKIDALPGAQRTILRLRYFEGYSWRQVETATHYTQRRCFQIHEEGVGNLE